MRVAELVMAVLLAALSVYMMWKSGLPAWEGDAWGLNIWYDDEGIGSGFWPFWLSLVMLLSCVWIMVNWVRRASPPARSDEPFLDAYGVRTLAKVGGGLFVFVLMIEGLSSFGVRLSPSDPGEAGSLGLLAGTVGWVVDTALGLAVYGVGMYGAMALFLLYYIFVLGRHPFLTALAIALGAPVATFFFFDVAMRIVLPKGYLEPLFIPLYDIFL